MLEFGAPFEVFFKVSVRYASGHRLLHPGAGFAQYCNDFKEKEIMNSKYIVFVIGLAAALTGCEGGGAPEVNSTNCSGAGMQAILPVFKTEAERQAFIDKCQALAQK